MKKLGLALGIGSSRAFAHVGFLKVLEKAHIKIDMISGASSASLVAAMYAAGMKPEQIHRKIKKKLKRWHLLMLFNPLPRILFPAPIFSGFVSSKRLEKFAQLFVGKTRFEDLVIPFAPSLLDLRTGEEVILEKGFVYKAIAGSMAIPGAFSPVKYKGKLLVDPGFFEAVPYGFLKKLKADISIGVMPVLEKDKYSVLQNLLKNKHMKGKIIFPEKINPDNFENNLIAHKNKLSYLDVIAYKGHLENIRILEAQFVWNKPDSLFLLPVPNMKPTQFLRASEAIIAGEFYTSKVIEEIKEIILKKRGKRAKKK